jgi:hypothetical protein
MKMRDFERKDHIDQALIDYLKRHVLSAADFKDGGRKDTDLGTADETWFTAPLCVMDNNERHVVGHERLRILSVAKNSPYITWDLPMIGDAVRIARAAGIELCGSGSVFRYGFVSGCPAYLSENMNVLLRLANGTQVVFHSLDFGKLQEQDNKIQEIMTLLTNYVPGQEVHLPIAPEYIIVGVKKTNENVFWPSSICLSMDGENNVLVPVGSCRQRERVQMTLDLPDGAKKHAHADVTYPAVENSLVMTVNKVQSTSKNKLILELNERHFPPKMTFNALHVALTRVTHGNGLRIMPLHDDSSLEYLMKLHPDDNLRKYMSGFASVVGSMFDAKLVADCFVLKKK